MNVAEVVAHLESLYPPATAEPWDSVGLICGDPEAPIRRVLFAVDPVAEVVDEAIEIGADLVVTHHPLFLKGVHSVAANTFKGALVHRLITAGIALYNAHTNADAAERGVAEALADAVGLLDTEPLVVAGEDVTTGIGRVGRLAEPMTLGQFAQRVADALPKVAQGVRVAGDLAAEVERIAVVGGSGDSLFDAVRAAGADAYVTSDLRHHPASELRERAVFEGGRPFLVDTAHYASEWLWLRYAAADLAAAASVAPLSATTSLPSPTPESHRWTRAASSSGSLDCQVSTRVTDPWTAVVHR